MVRQAVVGNTDTGMPEESFTSDTVGKPDAVSLISQSEDEQQSIGLVK